MFEGGGGAGAGRGAEETHLGGDMRSTRNTTKTAGVSARDRDVEGEAGDVYCANNPRGIGFPFPKPGRGGKKRNKKTNVIFSAFGSGPKSI